MLIPREDIGGRVVLDSEADECWFESRRGTTAPILERPVSATFELDRKTPRTWRDQSRIKGPITWATILDRLRGTGILRLNLAGIEAISCRDLEALIQEATGREFAVVASARGCTPKLVERLESLRGAGLQIFFDPERETGRKTLSLTEKLEILRQCVAAFPRVRVVTGRDPNARMTLAEFGLRLSLENVRYWRIYPRDVTLGPESLLTDSELEEIHRLSGESHWRELRFGSFRDRELGIVVARDGSVLTQAAPGLRPTFAGDVEQLADGGLLAPAFLKRQTTLWVTVVYELEGGRASSREDRRLAMAVEPTPLYQVFLCYNRQDLDFVISVHDRLEEARIKTWLDLRRLKAGEYWRERVQEALENSQSIVIFVGPEGLGPVQKREMEVALDLADKKGVQIIPAILPGVKDPSAVPLFLRTPHCVDFRLSDPDPLQELIRALDGTDGHAEPSSLPLR